MAAGFTLDNSVSLQQVQAASDPTDLLLPVDDYFSDKDRLTLDPAAEKKVRNGMTVGMPGLAPGQYRVYGQDGVFLALCEGRDGKLITVKSFFEV